MEPQMKVILTQLLEIAECIPELDAKERCQLLGVLTQIFSAILSSIVKRVLQVDYKLTDDAAGEGQSLSWQVAGSDIGDLHHIATLIHPGVKEEAPENEPQYAPLQHIKNTIRNFLEKMGSELDEHVSEMRMEDNAKSGSKSPKHILQSTAKSRKTTMIGEKESLQSADDRDYVLRLAEDSAIDNVISTQKATLRPTSQTRSVKSKRTSASPAAASDAVVTKKTRQSSSRSRRAARRANLNIQLNRYSTDEEHDTVDLNPDNPPSAETESDDEQGKPEYLCVDCEMQPFPNRDDFHNHIKESHIMVEGAVTKFICPVCSKVVISMELGKAQLASVYLEHFEMCFKKPKPKVVQKTVRKLYCIFCNVDWVHRVQESSEKQGHELIDKYDDVAKEEVKGSNNRNADSQDRMKYTESDTGENESQESEKDDAHDGISGTKDDLVSFHNRTKLRNHMMMHVTKNEFTYTLRCPLCGEEWHSARNWKKHLSQRLETHVETVHHIEPLSLEVINVHTEPTVEPRKHRTSAYGERNKLISERSRNADYPKVHMTWQCRMCEQKPQEGEKSLEFHLMSEHVVIKEDASHIACPECDWVSQVPYRATTSPRQVACHYINHAVLSHALLTRNRIVITSSGNNSLERDHFYDNSGNSVSEKDGQKSDDEWALKCRSGKANLASEQAPNCADAELKKLNWTFLSPGESSSSTLEETASLINRASGDLLSDEGLVTGTTAVSDQPRTCVNIPAPSQALNLAPAPSVTLCDNSNAMAVPSTARAITAEETTNTAGDSDKREGNSSAVQKVVKTGDMHLAQAETPYVCVLCMSDIRFPDNVALLRHFVCEHVLEVEEKKIFNIACAFCPHTIVRSKCSRPAASVLWTLYMKILAHMIRNHGCPVPSFVKVFTCWKCGYETIMRCRLAEHMDRQHEIKLDLQKHPQENVPNVGIGEISSWRQGPQHDSATVPVQRSLRASRSSPKSDPSSGLYQCDRCPKTLTSKTGLKRHLRSFHDKERTILCTHCGQKFYAQADLRAHSWTVHKVNITGKELSVCDICGESLPQFCMGTHRLKHDQQDYMCDVCGKWLKGAARMRDHKTRVHENRKNGKYRCDVCDRECHDARSLVLHHATVHEKTGVRCPLCNKLLADSSLLNEHMNTVHPGGLRINYCKICDKQLCSMDAFGNHMYVAHKVNITKRKVEKCEQCGFETLAGGLMRKHLAVHRRSAENPVQCDLCEKVCNCAVALAEHKRRCHSGHSFQCPHCAFNSKFKSKLTKHIARIHEKKKFNCETCAYKTFTEALFKKHQRVVHGIGAHEENAIISSMIQQYPEARVESRYVPPASNRNMFSVDSHMEEVRPAERKAPIGALPQQPEMRYMTTDEVAGESYQLEYIW